jgi:hypothetical protein
MMPGRILCYVMIIQWVVVHQSEQNEDQNAKSGNPDIQERSKMSLTAATRVARDVV